jgi:hypothetical protein
MSMGFGAQVECHLEKKYLFHHTLPEVGLSKAPSILSKVDLPLPEGPTTDTNSPLFTEKLTLFRDTTLPVDEE